MKKLAIVIINAYQLIVSPFIHAVTGTTHACRYNLTCSEYAKQKIQEKGIIQGSILAGKRILSCHPFAKVTPYQV